MARSNAPPIPLFGEQSNPQMFADRGGMRKEQRPPYKPAKESFQGPAQRRDKPGRGEANCPSWDPQFVQII